jgi:hypothetical protein
VLHPVVQTGYQDRPALAGGVLNGLLQVRAWRMIPVRASETCASTEVQPPLAGGVPSPNRVDRRSTALAAHHDTL